MQTLFLKTIVLLFLLYFIICLLLFFFQEKLIFFPDKLPSDFSFSFGQNFGEITIKTKDGKRLNSGLFTATASKGLIFFLHGNAGSLNTWGETAKFYNDLQYDVFMLDYRGFGKSEGAITNQPQLLDDVQRAYDEMKKRYPENKIIVIGYSIGTGPAARIAAVNKPRLLILQAPYFSLTDMMRYRYPVIPTFILRYKLETNKYLQACTLPVFIFHGDRDEVIYYGSSVKLKTVLKDTDQLITLHNQGHIGITDNPAYQMAIKKILSEQELY